MFNERPAYWMNPRDEYDRGLHHLRQRFRNELASGLFQEPGGSVFFNGFLRMMAAAGIAANDLRWFQVNLPAKHIVESVVEELATVGVPRSALYTRMDRMGYAGPPMAFIALDALMREEALAPGDRVVSFVTEVSKFMQAGYVLRRL
jgi:3-oxoacyl-[acyl-carrier-protein] synthase III